MHRRKFIKHTGLGAAALVLGTAVEVFSRSTTYPDIVEVTGSDTREMLSTALRVFGFAEKLKLADKSILLKASLVHNQMNGSLIHSDPELVKELILTCYKEEAQSVYATGDPQINWKEVYKSSGIEKATKTAFGKIMPPCGAEDSLVRGTQHFHPLLKLCDRVLNVSCFQVEEGEILQSACSNLSGLTLANKRNMQQDANEILGVVSFIKPGLNILEVKTEDEDKKKYILGSDPIILDAYCCGNKLVQSHSFFKQAKKAGYQPERAAVCSVQKIYM